MKLKTRWVVPAHTRWVTNVESTSHASQERAAMSQRGALDEVNYVSS